MQDIDTKSIAQLIPEKKREGEGSFFAGLAIGAVAGACGLFLFGTKKGKKTVNNLKKEWKQTTKKLKEEYGDEFTGDSLKATLANVLEQVQGFIEKESQVKTQQKQQRQQKKKSFFHR